jgi:hypothetical protein
MSIQYFFNNFNITYTKKAAEPVRLQKPRGEAAQKNFIN